MQHLERGLDDLVVMLEQRERGALDDRALMIALDRWQVTHGREIEHLAREAARSAGPDARAELAERWRALSERLDAISPTAAGPERASDTAISPTAARPAAGP